MISKLFRKLRNKAKRDRLTTEEAESIILEVCDEHIPNKYHFSIIDEHTVTLQSLDKSISFGWDLNEFPPNEDLLHCDAHAFCAYIIRNASEDESERSPLGLKRKLRR